MDHELMIVNGIASLCAAALLSLIVLHPRIHEGPVIKLGLICMIFGCLGSFAAAVLAPIDQWPAHWNAGIAVRCGIGITACGVLLRLGIGEHCIARLTGHHKRPAP